MIWNIRLKKWITELAPVASFFSSLKGLFGLKPEDATRDMALTTNKDIFVTINGILYKTGKDNGKIAWKTESKINVFEINKAEKGGEELVKVRKEDGKEVDRLDLDGTKPVYEVDSFNGNLYYVKGKELRVYSSK